MQLNTNFQVNSILDRKAQSPHALSPSQRSVKNISLQNDIVLEQHQQQISKQDHLTYAIHESIVNRDTSLQNSQFIAAQNNIGGGSPRKINESSQYQLQTESNTKLNRNNTTGRNSPLGEKTVVPQGTNLNQTIGKMRFQKEIQGKNVPFKINENERNKSMKPYRSKSRLFALQQNVSSKKIVSGMQKGRFSPMSKNSGRSSDKDSKKLSSVGEQNYETTQMAMTLQQQLISQKNDTMRMVSTLEELNESNHDIQNSTHKAFQTLNPSSDTSEHFMQFQNVLQSQSPILVQISQSDQTNNVPVFTSPPMINTNMQSGYGSPLMDSNQTGSNKILQTSKQTSEVPLIQTIQLLPQGFEAHTLISPPIYTDNSLSKAQIPLQQIEQLQQALHTTDQMPTTDQGQVQKLEQEEQFDQRISGLNIMPMKTAQQDILNKVSYQNRTNKERNIMDKYNRVKKKKLEPPQESSQIQVLRMPYYQRVGILMKQQEEKIAQEYAEQQKLMEQSQLMMKLGLQVGVAATKSATELGQQEGSNHASGDASMAISPQIDDTEHLEKDVLKKIMSEQKQFTSNQSSTEALKQLPNKNDKRMQSQVAIIPSKTLQSKVSEQVSQTVVSASKEQQISIQQKEKSQQGKSIGNLINQAQILPGVDSQQFQINQQQTQIQNTNRSLNNMQQQIIKDFGFVNTSTGADIKYIDTNLIDKQLEYDNNSMEDKGMLSQSKDYYSAHLSPYLSNQARSRSNLQKPQSPFFSSANQAKYIVVNHKSTTNEQSTIEDDKMLTSNNIINPFAQSSSAVNNQIMSNKTVQMNLRSFANFSQNTNQLSVKQLNDLILQKNVSYKIENDKKLNQQKQMVVQAIQLEVANQQLKTIIDYEKQLEEEQEQLNKEEEDQEPTIDQSEIEINHAKQQLQFYKKQKEQAQTQLQQLKLNGKIEYIQNQKSLQGLIGLGNKSKPQLKLISQNVPSFDSTPYREQILSIARAQNVNLSLLGMVTPIYKGTYETQSVASKLTQQNQAFVSTEKRPESATKELRAITIMSNPSIESHIRKDQTLEIPENDNIKVEENHRFSRTLMNELNEAFGQTKNKFNKRTMDQRVKSKEENDNSQALQSLNKDLQVMNSRNAFRQTSFIPDHNKNKFNTLERKYSSSKNQLHSIHSRKRSMFEQNLNQENLMPKNLEKLIMPRQSSFIMRSKRLTIANQEFMNKFAQVNSKPQHQQNINPFPETFQELNMTKQQYSHQQIQRFEAIKAQQSKLRQMPQTSKNQQNLKLPEIKQAQQQQNMNSLQISPLKAKRASLQPQMPPKLSLKSQIIAQPKMILPKIQTKRQSPMHQVQMQREMGNIMKFDFGSQAQEEDLHQDNQQKEHIDTQETEDTQAKAKRKTLKVGIAIQQIEDARKRSQMTSIQGTNEQFSNDYGPAFALNMQQRTSKEAADSLMQYHEAMRHSEQLHDTAQIEGTSSAMPSDYHHQMQAMLPWGSNIHQIISPQSKDSKYTFGPHGNSLLVIHSPAFIQQVSNPSSRGGPGSKSTLYQTQEGNQVSEIQIGAQSLLFGKQSGFRSMPQHLSPQKSVRDATQNQEQLNQNKQSNQVQKESWPKLQPFQNEASSPKFQSSIGNNSNLIRFQDQQQILNRTFIQNRPFIDKISQQNMNNKSQLYPRLNDSYNIISPNDPSLLINQIKNQKNRNSKIDIIHTITSKETNSQQNDADIINTEYQNPSVQNQAQLRDSKDMKLSQMKRTTIQLSANSDIDHLKVYELKNETTRDVKEDSNAPQNDKELGANKLKMNDTLGTNEDKFVSKQTSNIILNEDDTQNDAERAHAKLNDPKMAHISFNDQQDTLEKQRTPHRIGDPIEQTAGSPLQNIQTSEQIEESQQPNENTTHEKDVKHSHQGNVQDQQLSFEPQNLVRGIKTDESINEIQQQSNSNMKQTDEHGNKNRRIQVDKNSSSQYYVPDPEVIDSMVQSQQMVAKLINQKDLQVDVNDGIEMPIVQNEVPFIGGQQNGILIISPRDMNSDYQGILSFPNALMIDKKQSPMSFEQTGPFNLDIQDHLNKSATSTAYDLLKNAGQTNFQQQQINNQLNYGAQITLKNFIPLKGLNIQTQAKAKIDQNATDSNNQPSQDDDLQMFIQGTNPFKKLAEETLEEGADPLNPESQYNYLMNHYGVVKILNQSLSSSHASLNQQDQSSKAPEYQKELLRMIKLYELQRQQALLMGSSANGQQMIIVNELSQPSQDTTNENQMSFAATAQAKNAQTDPMVSQTFIIDDRRLSLPQKLQYHKESLIQKQQAKLAAKFKSSQSQQSVNSLNHADQVPKLKKGPSEINLKTSQRTQQRKEKQQKVDLIEKPKNIIVKNSPSKVSRNFLNKDNLQLPSQLEKQPRDNITYQQRLLHSCRASTTQKRSLLNKHSNQGSGLLKKQQIATNVNLSNLRTNSKSDLAQPEDIGVRLSGRNVDNIKKQADPLKPGYIQNQYHQQSTINGAANQTQSIQSLTLALGSSNLDFSRSPSMAVVGSRKLQSFNSAQKNQEQSKVDQFLKSNIPIQLDINKQVEQYSAQGEPMRRTLTHDPSALVDQFIKNLKINLISHDDQMKKSKSPNNINHLLPKQKKHIGNVNFSNLQSLKYKNYK